VRSDHGRAYGVYRAVLSERARSTQQDPIPELPVEIDPKDLELFDMSLEDSGFLNASVTGRVRNKSSIVLHGFDLWVQLYQDDGKADSAGVRVRFDPPVPGQEAKSFQATIKGLRFPGKWTWKYELYNAIGPAE
jgi:hypothetical protein